MINYAILNKININLESDEKVKLINKINKYISKKMETFNFSKCDLNDDKKIDYIFCIGGDGTMIHAINIAIKKQSKIIGINAGNIGFLTPYNIEDVFNDRIFNFIHNENIRHENRAILNIDFNNNKKDHIIAVNEIAIYNEINKLVNFSLRVKFESKISMAGEYSANTLIISSPVGSTAYNKNVGGALLDPEMSAMQLVMVAPTTKVSPLILGIEYELIIEFNSNSKIFIDGQFYKEYKSGDSIKISISKNKANIIVPERWNFYTALVEKLNYNK